MNGNFTFVNNHVSDTFGYSKEEIEHGLNILHLIAPEWKTKAMKNFRRLKNGEDIGINECIAIKKDGSTFPILSHTFPVVKGNTLIGIRGIVEDISDRVEAETEIKKLSLAAQQSPAIIAITDINGKLEFVNLKFEELTGYIAAEALGKNPSILKSGEHSAEMYQELWETISSGKIWRGELRNKKKNGELYWESAYISPVFNKQGEIINYLKLAEDITERKRKEQIQKIIYNITNAVITSIDLQDFAKVVQKELSTIIDTTNFYIALYNEKANNFTFAFQQDEKDRFKTIPADKTLTGYVFKTKKSLLVTKKVKKELEKSGKVVLLGTESKSWLGIPLVIDKKAIGVFAVQSYTSENTFKESDIEILEIISHQISISIDRKQKEEELKAALEKAQESDRLKSAFLANMSHEIRTPMNGILGFANLISEPGLSDFEKQEYITFIKESSDRMLNTINDLIEISKIEAGENKVSVSTISLNKLLDEILAKFTPEAELKGLQLASLPTLKDDTATLLTDKSKLLCILTKLIKNAIKFTKKGKISFGYLLKDNFIEFFVKDTGIGIPKNRQQAIFNRFEQGDPNYNTRQFEGSGLGLAITKAYVEMLGGKIWLISKEGKGTTFKFTIPYETAIDYKTQPAPQTTKLMKKEALNTNLEILIVEDDKTSYLYLETILKDKFRKIHYATSGKEAIEIFRSHPDISLILMDIKMPGMNGLEATREIRKFDKEVIIIAQTAYTLTGNREKALEAGCDDYIAKPIIKENLFEIISSHLKKKKFDQES